MDTKKPQQPKPPNSHPLVGAGLHYKDEKGAVQNQAMVAAVVPSGSPVGDLALIQYFDWFHGDPSTRRLIPLAELASSDRWVLYSSVEEMSDHFERIDRHRNDHLLRKTNGKPPEAPQA